MRESMIHELYYGNISPWERRRIRDPEFAALTDKIDKIVTHFETLLSPKNSRNLRGCRTCRHRPAQSRR